MKFVKIIIIIIILFFNYEIFSDNYMQCIITHYEIEKTDKIKNEVNKIEFNQDGTKRTEKTYQVNYFNILELFYISVYEYPDKNTIILYYNTKETRAYKTIYKYNDLNKLVSIIEYSCEEEISLNNWEKKCNKYNYTKELEFIYKYNDKGDLILAEAIQGKFVSNPGPLNDLPNDNLNGKFEEFKYEYNEKNQKIKVFGKFQKTGSYYKEGTDVAYGEWQYFYDDNRNLIKLEKYGLNGLYSYTEYKYTNKKLIDEFYYSGDYSNGKRTGYKIVGYDSYEYYKDGRLKRVNHHDVNFKKIEDMKIYAYDEYTYK